MNASIRYKIVVSLVSVLTAVALSAHAEEQSGSAPKKPPPAGKAAVQQTNPAPGRPGPVVGRGPQDAHVARGSLPARNFGGHAYRGRLAWEGGRWRHEVYNGRDGWWWDVGGVRYITRNPWKVRPPMSRRISSTMVLMDRPLPSVPAARRLSTAAATSAA